MLRVRVDVMRYIPFETTRHRRTVQISTGADSIFDTQRALVRFDVSNNNRSDSSARR